MTTLNHSNNGLLAQELVLGQQTSKHCYPLVYEQKKHIAKFGDIGPSFNPNKTWNRHKRLATLHRSFNDLVAQELVSGQQTSKH